MKNLYKCTDIFRCVHESHKGYKNKISVFHILEKKRCYPDGCIYFKWRCKQLNKRNKCSRGFSHVGRKCFGCRDFYEEKIHNYPELMIGEEEYQEFLKQLDYFEDWLEENRNRKIEFCGRVSNVKPYFLNKIYPKANFLSFRGYILVFNNIYINLTDFNDFTYLNISSKYYQSLKPGAGYQLEGYAYLKTDQGRIVLYRPGGIVVTEKGKPAFWDEPSVMVARETATKFSFQPENCVQCPFGALVDVSYVKDHPSCSRRDLYCLKGMKDFKDCYVPVEFCGLEREANASLVNDCDKPGKIYLT